MIQCHLRSNIISDFTSAGIDNTMLLIPNIINDQYYFGLFMVQYYFRFHPEGTIPAGIDGPILFQISSMWEFVIQYYFRLLMIQYYFRLFMVQYCFRLLMIQYYFRFLPCGNSWSNIISDY